MTKKLEDKIKVMLPTPDFVPPQIIEVSKSEYKENMAKNRVYRKILLGIAALGTILYLVGGGFNDIKNHDWKAEYNNFQNWHFPQP
jgi:hypothetical protein